MAIEQLGESLLAQAKKRTKKKKRKGDIMAATVLGLTGANYLLKQKAAKRIDELNRSYTPIINQKTQQLKKGVQFWTEHKDLLDEENYSHEQWKDAYFVRAKKQIKQQNSIEAKNNTEAELDRITREKIADDLKAYEAKLEAYSQFKNYKDTETEIARYIAPITRTLSNSQKLIERNNTVGGKIMAAFGSDKYRGELDEIKTDDSRLIQIAEGVDIRDKQELITFLDNQAKSMSKLKSVTDGVDYDLILDSKQLELFKETIAPKIDSGIKDYTNKYFSAAQKDRDILANLSVTVKDDNKPVEINLGEVYDTLSDKAVEGEVLSPRRKLNYDINLTASIIQANNKVNGIIVSDSVAVQEALGKITGLGKLGMQTIKRIGRDRVEFTYSQLTQDEIAVLAGNKPKDIPEGEPYDLSDEAKDITNKAASVTDEVTTVSFETLGTPQKVNMAKQISLDSDIINEPIEVIQEEFNTILNSIPETDIENRNLVTSYLENTLKRQQSSQGSSDKTQEKKQDTTEFTFETDINISDRPIINKIIEVESSGNPNAVSDHGAKGLMQLKDSTADNPGLGVRPAVRNADGSISPEENVRVGTDYFDALTEKYGGDLVTAAMAYNAGMGTIDKWIDDGRDFNKLRTETQNYVKKIFGEDTYNELKNPIQDSSSLLATSDNLDRMNPGEKLRYNKTLNRLNKAKEKLEDSNWLDNATQKTIKAQQDVVEKSTKELQSIVDKAGTSFFISLLTPESERLQQRIDVVVGKLENENLSTNQRKKLESDLERLETEFDNL